MAISGFGTIFIQLDKGSYSPGEQVNGTIFLNLVSNYVRANQLWVQITGLEETKLIEQRSRQVNHRHGDRTVSRTEHYYVTHHDVNSFFNHRFPVYTFPTAFLPAGQYSFPVSFILARGIPSTFNYEFFKHGQNYGRVNYCISAMVESPGMGLQIAPMRSVQTFVVNQENIVSSGAMRKEMNKKVTSCCCISKGHSKIITYFEKNDYCPGETAYMVAEVDNSQGKAEIQQVRGIFKQSLKLTARGYTERININHHEMQVSGIKPGATLLGEKAQRLEVVLRSRDGSSIQPTCRGRLVSNEYHLINKLKMDACLCCDDSPACEIILNVRNPDMVYQKFVQPSNWHPQVMAGYNAQFSSEFSAPPPPIPQYPEFSSPDQNHGGQNYPSQGMPPAQGGMPNYPSQPGMPSFPNQPGMPPNPSL